MSYEKLTDKEFLGLIFSKGDTLGEDFLKEAKKRRDAILPHLRNVVLDESNYQKEDEDFWGVIHAVHLLGILEDEQGIEALFSALEYSSKYDIDWIWEALPECFLKIGKASLPRLIEYLKRDEDVSKKLTIMESIWNLYQEFPEERSHIEQFFLKLLNDASVDPEMKGYIVANFAEMGKSNLRPLFDKLFDRGEIDLETVTPDDIEYFLTQSPRIPIFIAGIEKFYNKEAINKRKERWKREKELEFLDSLLENYHRIGRNEPCPCGSGKKFKKCHLPILEARKREIEAIEAREERLEQLFENRLAISMEREAEMKIRQILARYHKTHLFKEIKESVIRAMKAPSEEFLEKGMSYYLQPVLDELEFLSEREVKEFLEHLRNYWNLIPATIFK